MTERDELSGEVWSLIRRAMDTPQTDNYEAESAYRDAYASEAAGKVIALIRADERRRVREALLSDEVLEMLAYDGGDSDLEGAREDMTAALTAAGLTEDER